MHFSNIFTTLATLGLSQAIITGISVPATIKPGDGFNAYINTADYIQSVYDVAVAFGVAPGAGYQGALGQVIDSFYLGPEQSNVVQPIPKWVTMSSTVQQGQAIVSAAVFSLYGAADAQTLTTYNVTVTIGDATSTNYVTSSP
jgi:Nis1 family